MGWLRTLVLGLSARVSVGSGILSMARELSWALGLDAPGPRDLGTFRRGRIPGPDPEGSRVTAPTPAAPADLDSPVDLVMY